MAAKANQFFWSERAGVMPALRFAAEYRGEHVHSIARCHCQFWVLAEELGFSDAFHLSKAFKQVVGLAPRDFLRDQRRGKP